MKPKLSFKCFCFVSAPVGKDHIGVGLLASANDARSCKSKWNENTKQNKWNQNKWNPNRKQNNWNKDRNEKPAWPTHGAWAGDEKTGTLQKQILYISNSQIN